jgi:hypothetical protein
VRMCFLSLDGLSEAGKEIGVCGFCEWVEGVFYMFRVSRWVAYVETTSGSH